MTRVTKEENGSTPSSDTDCDAVQDGGSSEEFDVCIELGALGDGSLVFESGLARMFGKHAVSIKRAVERGELPPPTRLMGKPVWTVGTIRKHIEDRLESETRHRAQMDERLARFST